MRRVPVVAGLAHLGHDPAYEVDDGRAIPPYERPARAVALRDALAEAGHPLTAPVAHGTAPVLAVHDAGFLTFLETAYERWRADGGPETLIPDTFASGRFRGGRVTASGRGAPGWWCLDTATPMVAGTWSAAREAADVALTAADLVAGGETAAYALCRPPGHHAGRALYGGFCFLNNAAVAARRLGELGPVAILDVDFHHGNGTQDIFWDDGSVLYVSLHGDPGRHYPYFSGLADETGEGPGAGANRNIPLPDGLGDDGYLRALERAASVVARFGPAALVVSLGFDALDGDPLGAFRLTAAGYGRIGCLLADLELPTLLVQEGGYRLEALGACATAVLEPFCGDG